jgi:hypothetical protein
MQSKAHEKNKKRATQRTKENKKKNILVLLKSTNTSTQKKNCILKTKEIQQSCNKTDYDFKDMCAQ